MKALLLLLLALPVISFAQFHITSAKFPIDDASTANLNDGIIGQWKFKEDTNSNNFYEVIREKPYAMDRYHILFWDRGGTNATYESNMHFSKIGDVLFLNVPSPENFSTHTYFFLKILKINADFTEMTAAVVHDTKLMNMNQQQVKQRISSNINNPAYYKDTVHLYKMR